jgi:hypothetical protein
VNEAQYSAVPTALENGRRSPKKLLRAVVARLARAEVVTAARVLRI